MSTWYCKFEFLRIFRRIPQIEKIMPTVW